MRLRIETVSETNDFDPEERTSMIAKFHKEKFGCSATAVQRALLTTSGIWGIAFAVVWELNPRQGAIMVDRSDLPISSAVPIKDAVPLCQCQWAH